MVVKEGIMTRLQAKELIRSVQFKFIKPTDPLGLKRLLNGEISLAFSTPVSIVNRKIKFKPHCEVSLSTKKKTANIYSVQEESNTKTFDLSVAEAVHAASKLELESDAIAFLVNKPFSNL